MSDAYTLHFRNYRSIVDATVAIAPLTVIYGANGSGKSSLLYGLLTLRNFLSNPSLNMPSLFSYPSIALGAFQEVVHDHATSRSISLSLGVMDSEEVSSQFTLTLGQSGGGSRIDFARPKSPLFSSMPQSLELPIALPYSVNQQVDHEMKGFAGGEHSAMVSWNGVTLSAQTSEGSPRSQEALRKFIQRCNLPMELARNTGFVPLRRGFSKPTYALTSVTSSPTTEDEVASILASPEERFRQYKVSDYIERITKRRVHVQPQIGTSTFTIDAIPTEKGIPASIVNEGFGINQLLYMLTICLHPPFKVVAVEEPEIHLHPSMVRELAGAMVEISTNEDRRLIISTHSEVFVVALLSQIAAGKLDANDVAFFLAENKDGQSTFKKQDATPDGQIQGGLQPFMASELEDLALFLGVGQ